MKNCTGIIIEKDDGKVLLQLRDDKVIEFPNYWVLLGGGMDDGETPEDGIRRELKEEIGIDIEDIRYFDSFSYKDLNQFFFYKRLKLDVDKIDLKEGKEIRFFSEKEIDDISIGFNIKEVLKSFFRWKNGQKTKR